MKVFSVLIISLLVAVHCDQQVSSYSSLPYEDEGHHPHQSISGSHPAPNAYEQPNYYETNFDLTQYNTPKKKGFSFGRIMKAPFNALKDMFDDAKTKFYELNGSILRARGNFLQGKGENMLRHAYKHASNGVYYPIQSYEPPQPYHTPPYQPAPGAVEGHGYHSNSLDNTHNVVSNDHHHADVSNAIDFHAPSAHDNDFSSHQFEQESISTGNDLFNNAGNFGGVQESTYAQVPVSQHRREFVEQRSARSFSSPWRTQRSYSVPVEDHRPIPVPVPISVYPSRLIFPSLHDMHQLGGYR